MRVLVLSAHPDDETLGCGGTLLKHGENGDHLFWLIATRAFEPAYNAKVIQQKSQEIKNVAAAYGFKEFYQLEYKTARLDLVSSAELIDHVHQIALSVRPDWIYLVNRNDVHSDHRILFDATMSAVKPFRAEFHAIKMLSYESLSSTDAAPGIANHVFVPNVFSDIGKYIEQKLEIMNLYQSEIQIDPLPRGPAALRALARSRGATMGIEYAEAFMLVRDFLQ